MMRKTVAQSHGTFTPTLKIFVLRQVKFPRNFLLEFKSGFLTFGRVSRSIQTHYLNIINFFERRATNAAAESFNAKIKAFRAQFRGVRDRAFFLYRLAKLYA